MSQVNSIALAEDAVRLPELSSRFSFQGLLGLLPGIGLLAVIGYAGKWIEQSIARYGKAHHLVLPNIEYVLWAILIGFIIGNTVGLPSIFRRGVATYEFWLKIGIVLLGARFILGDIGRLGGISLALVFVELILALSFMTALGRGFKLSPKLVTLLAVGSSVCGVSAIIATQGAIDADEQDTSFAIAAILALGALSLILFPIVGHALHMSDHAYGVWTGLAVDNTAEATAAGALYSDAAGKFAVLAKTCRNAMIGFVVLGYALYWASQGQTVRVGNKAAFLWQKFPKFVLGFLLISLLATVGVFSKPELASLGNLSRWAFLLTFAGVGLRTNLRDLLRQGIRPFLVGAIGEVVIATLTLGLVYGADRLYHL
ncbi:YeiH family protein [Terriglobus aquaticus]|uniref:YeiH family protein n=1 Tax=Terriglobus aquaticus TaxID=940139 RepID=A0ABW9KHE4_9BACT|nr:YeiH family protein [Terriglobus aquaticus]